MFLFLLLHRRNVYIEKKKSYKTPSCAIISIFFKAMLWSKLRHLHDYHYPVIKIRLQNDDDDDDESVFNFQSSFQREFK